MVKTKYKIVHTLLLKKFSPKRHGALLTLDSEYEYCDCNVAVIDNKMYYYSLPFDFPSGVCVDIDEDVTGKEIEFVTIKDTDGLDIKLHWGKKTGKW